MPIPIMICFARSGGTLLNKCLGSLPNVVIMSEVNPLGGGYGKMGSESYTTIKAQAKHWYNIDLKSDDFVESVIELYEKCEKLNKHLIIRDWSFCNFVPCKENKFNPPNKLLTLEKLTGKIEIKPFSFVRDAIDVWISRDMPQVEQFFGEYLKYIEAVKKINIPVFKYEDFCKTPSKTMEAICDYIGLKFNESYKNYQNFDKVNGDVQVAGGSRGIKQKQIALLPRKIIPRKKIQEIKNCDNLSKVNILMGYSINYYSRKREPLLPFYKKNLKKYLKIA